MNTLFRTEIQLPKLNVEIDYQSSAVFLGSCFSDNIGQLLLKNKLPVVLNPFGVLYNPASIAQAIQLALENTKLKASDLVEHNHQWHSFYFHGSFSGSNKKQLIQKANSVIASTRQELKNAKTLFITFGTAWVYEWIKTEQIVANCHKIPAKHFKRYRLNVHNIVELWSNILPQLLALNPELKIVFTVSPVRHLKDGMHENQLSKATLLLAIDELIKQAPGNVVNYFPSYEMVNDDLRDYRFYGKDMVHISESAIEYIFDQFKTSFFSPATMQIFSEINAIVLLKKHRILSNNKNEIEKFSKQALKKIKIAEEKYPYIKFELEKQHFKNLLS